MHETPLKRSVTAPHSSSPYPSGASLPSITVTENALGSFTPGGLSRHRTVSPYPHPRLYSPNSPRPSDLLSHKDVVLGRSRSRSPKSISSGSSIQSKKSSDSLLHVESSSPTISRVYESTSPTPKSSVLSSKPPSIIISGVEESPETPPLKHHSNASSQSYLGVYTPNHSPQASETDQGRSGDLGVSQATLSEALNFATSEDAERGSKISRSIRKKFPGYVAAEVERISRSDPGVNGPHFQFPVLRDAMSSGLSTISPEDFQRKSVVGDPDPSFHRSINSPVAAYPGEVVLEQVGSFHVHRLRNDSLGELPHFSTVEELLQFSPPLSTGARSPKKGTHSVSAPGASPKTESPSPRQNITPPKPTIAPFAAAVGEEIAPSTVVLPGEYGRRYHSRAGARSRGNKNIGVPLQISTKTELKSEIIVGARVTPEGPPATPESPFTSISREQTRLKGIARDSPSPLITFLSAIKPVVGSGNRKPMPPGKGNPDWIQPTPKLGATTVVCFTHAYGHLFYASRPDFCSTSRVRPGSLGSMIIDNGTSAMLSTIPSHVTSVHMCGSLGSIIAENQAATIASSPRMHYAGNTCADLLSSQNIQKTIERDDRGLLSSN